MGDAMAGSEDASTGAMTATVTPNGGPADGKSPADDPASQTALQYIFAAFLLLYIFPVALMAFFFLLQTSPDETSGLARWMIGFMKDPDSSIGLLHRALLPLATALSASLFLKRLPTQFLYAAAAIIFIGIVLGLLAEGYVRDDQILKNLGQSDSDFRLHALAMISKIQETTLVYLLMLLGISGAQAMDKKG